MFSISGLSGFHDTHFIFWNGFFYYLMEMSLSLFCDSSLKNILK